MKKRAILPEIILTILSVMAVVPFILVVIASFTGENELLLNGYTFFPSSWSLQAYKYIWNQGTAILRAYGITIIVTLLGTSIGLALTMMVGYGLSRKDLPGRNGLAFYVFFTMLFNGGLVPTYLMYVRIFGIKNTLAALIIPGLLMNGFNVMIMRSYFSNNVPESLIESAYMDGAGEFRIFLQVVLPLSKPIVATIALFIGISYWNDWYNGLIYLTDSKLFSIQNVLNRLISDAQFLASSNFGNANISNITLPTTATRMAMAVITLIPIMAAYPFFQKYFVKGITIGAVKG